MTGPRGRQANCGERLLERLAERGVDQVFGIPGNHTVELYRGFEAAGIGHLTCRHEQGAAFMADGYARASGRVGVCVLISGPGLLNAATAIAQARADSVPLLVISGVAARGDLGMGRGVLHELPDQHATAASFCRWSHTLLDSGNLDAVLERAFNQFSAARPGPVHLEIPLDLMAAPAAVATASLAPAALPPAPNARGIAEASAWLQAASSPLLLLGGGAQNAQPSVVKLAERLDAPVLNTVNGKGVCPADHPLAVGGSPSVPALAAALAQADVVLALGTEFSETDYDLLMTGAPEYAGRLIRVDIDPDQLSANRSASLALLADVGQAADALLAELGEGVIGNDSPGRQRAIALRQALADAEHNHPDTQAFLDTLAEASGEAVIVGDSARPTYYASWQLERQRPRRYFHSVSGFGTLGYALPAAFGAALAHDGGAVALLGDGGMQFTLPELSTGAQAGLAVPVVVWNNQGYGEIANSMKGQGVAAGSTVVRSPDFAAAAQAHHCAYAQPRDLAALGNAVRQALQGDRPTVIEVDESDFLSQPAGDWYP